MKTEFVEVQPDGDLQALVDASLQYSAVLAPGTVTPKVPEPRLPEDAAGHCPMPSRCLQVYPEYRLFPLALDEAPKPDEGVRWLLSCYRRTACRAPRPFTTRADASFIPPACPEAEPRSVKILIRPSMRSAEIWHDAQ